MKGILTRSAKDEADEKESRTKGITIFTLKKRKVGFTINKERLAFIRQQRLKYAGSIDYTDIMYIQEELEYSHKIFRRIKNIQVIDVTSRSIEEIANTIV